jgi:hypothetical protein
LSFVVDWIVVVAVLSPFIRVNVEDNNKDGLFIVNEDTKYTCGQHHHKTNIKVIIDILKRTILIVIIIIIVSCCCVIFSSSFG